jgi:hypothetical protein
MSEKARKLIENVCSMCGWDDELGDYVDSDMDTIATTDEPTMGDDEYDDEDDYYFEPEEFEY